MTDVADPVAVNVPKDNSHSASDVDAIANFTSSGNGSNDASNLPSPNNSEEPLPPELWLSQIPIQVSAPHTVVYPWTV